jgi:hypothetical protein
MCLVALSIRTLLAAAAVLTAFNCLVLMAFHLTRKTYPGFLQWTMGNVAAALGYGLLILRGQAPGILTIVLANSLLPLAIVIRLDGVSRFLLDRRIAFSWWLLPAAAAVATSAFYWLSDDIPARMVVAAVGISIPAGMAAMLFGRHAPHPSGSLHLWTAGIIAGLAVVVAAKAVVTVQQQSGMWGSSLLNLLFFLTIVVIEAAWTIAFLLLNAERVEWELRDALAHVKVLRGLLRTCSWCRKVRDDHGYWQQIERYVEQHSEAELSHGICPDCAALLHSEAQAAKGMPRG